MDELQVKEKIRYDHAEMYGEPDYHIRCSNCKFFGEWRGEKICSLPLYLGRDNRHLAIELFDTTIYVQPSMKCDFFRPTPEEQTVAQQWEAMSEK